MRLYCPACEVWWQYNTSSECGEAHSPDCWVCGNRGVHEASGAVLDDDLIAKISGENVTGQPVSEGSSDPGARNASGSDEAPRPTAPLGL